MKKLVQSWALYNQNSQYIKSTTYTEPKFVSNLGKGATGASMKVLQEVLLEIGYDVDISGVYDAKTINGVYLFQRDHELVSDENNQAAGYFGKATRNVLADAYKDFKKTTDDIKRTSKEKSRENAVLILQSSKIRWQAQYGEKDGGVYTLQQFLKMLGFFDDKPTGMFGPVTKDSLVAFQKKMGIVYDEGSTGAGIVGPKTTTVLWNEVAQFLVQIYLPTRDLARGNRGLDVEKLQRGLAFLGWYEGAVNGVYGEETEASVAKFQEDMELIKGPKDKGYGVLGPKTKAMMELVLTLHPGVYLGLPNEW